jgi:hypothetical protein
MASDGFLFSHLTDNLTTDNGLHHIETINKVIFLQENDKIFSFDDELLLTFPKFLQKGQIDMNDNIMSTTRNLKLLIEINLRYVYDDAEFAPRYTFDVYKNGELYSSRRCGLSDEVGYTNSLNLILVIDTSNDDLIELKLNKNTEETSVSSMTILDNSFVIFKTF